MNAKLYKHQEEAIKFILSRGGSGALFMEVGTGKTLTALTIKERLEAKKTLVVCPISLINAAWGEDIKKFTNLSYTNLRKSSDKADIYIINFESYAKKRHIIQSLGIDMIIIDESSKCKNFKSQITKTLLKDKSLYKYRLVMSGTPAPNNETEYWAQVNFVSEVFPDSFYKFRNTYFHLTRGNQTAHGYMPKQSLTEMFRTGWKYTVKDKNLFMYEVRKAAFWAKKEECLDLPEQVDIKREVILSPYQQKHYKEMKKTMITDIEGNLAVANVALTKLMKLRQITSGFAITPEGEPVDLKDNSKLNELKQVLDEIGDKQVIIWLQFHQEFNHILKELENTTTLYALTKDKDKSIDLFKTGQAQYLLAHPRSAGHGLTFTNCQYEIFYSFDYSFEMMEQAKGRIHRPGQKNKCTYIYLIAQNTIDENILDALSMKQSLQELILKIKNG